MSSLADRVRGIVRVPGSRAPLIDGRLDQPDRADRPAESGASQPVDEAGWAASAHLERTLGGEWRQGCFVVERRWDVSARHGREAVGAVADRLRHASAEAPLFAGGAPAREPFVFFDLETTGLSGGAGTHVFLVGCGWFAEQAFVTRQFLLASFSGERALLDMVSRQLAGAGAIVSFNGKSFDAPVLEARYLFHRLDWPAAEVPHLDVLHSARQFWKAGRQSPLRATTPRPSGHGCSLLTLERQVLGHRRGSDVAGFEIPSRYFQFIRTADPDLLVEVLEHNRVDLLSLAALTARLLHLAGVGPQAARDGREALALGRLYARAGLAARARDAFHSALETSAACPAADREIQIEALRALAILLRRARRFEEAAGCWRRLVAMPGCSDRLACDATEALAIHHEHRVRDLVAARTFALQTLEKVGCDRQAARNEAVRHRLARLERKMGALVSDSRSSSPSLSLFSLLPPSSGFQTSARRTSS